MKLLRSPLIFSDGLQMRSYSFFITALIEALGSVIRLQQCLMTGLCFTAVLPTCLTRIEEKLG